MIIQIMFLNHIDLSLLACMIFLFWIWFLELRFIFNWSSVLENAGKMVSPHFGPELECFENFSGASLKYIKQDYWLAVKNKMIMFDVKISLKNGWMHNKQSFYKIS